MKKKRKNFSRKAIRAYWSNTEIWQNHFDSKEEFLFEENACFACGFIYGYNLERAHIHALWKGGQDEVSNIHLLCRICHEASEDFCGEVYWRWFNSRNVLHVVMTRACKYNLFPK